MTKYGLRAQVIAYTILPTIFIGGILAGYFSFHRYQQANELLINRAINIAEPLAIASEYGMQDETRTILRRLIGTTHRKNSPIIKSIAIFTANNDLFVISNYHRDYKQLRLSDDKPIPDLPQVTFLDKTIVIHTPIIDETNFLEYQLSFDQPRKIIGYVALEINRDEVELLLYRDAAVSLLVVLLGILGSLYLAFKQAKRITAPISEMASVVEKISLGRLNSRVEGEYTGEISLLQRGINEMAVAMSKHHEEMQDSIDLATSELRETLDQMEVQNIELDITRKEAQQAASVKSEFLANMSHELRTPLNGVIGFARQLLKTQMTNNQVDYLQTIERSAGNLLNIINDILDFSKLEAGKLDLEHIPFDIRECIDETMHLLAQSAHEKNIELSMIVGTDVPQELVGDSMRLQQILTNLIGNAIKFTEQGNIEVQIQRIEKEDTHKNNNIGLKFIISDTGIGISENQQKQLFEAFGQADSSITRQYGGTGLGLVITQKLVHEMKGTIDLVSTPNIGSTFWFTIEVEKNTRTPLISLPLERLSGRVVLAYESNEYAVRSCAQLLNHWNTDVTITETELQWTKALNQRYDSIVIGHSNNTNIRPLLNRIEQAKPHTDNIIVLLNSSDPSVYEQLMDTGITHCLSKPINHKNFANALVSNETTPSRLQISLPLQRKNINVMAVDDNQANLKLISAMLTDRVNRVTTCKNGQEAVEHAKQVPFDIIFMDIQMPVLDGVSACAQIKKDSLNQESPIIAVTAHVLPGEKEQFLQKGMDDCLAKPIDEQALQAIINKWAPNAKILEVLPTTNIANHPVKKIETSNNKSFDWSLALKQSAGKADLAKEMLLMLLNEFNDIRDIANKVMLNEVANEQLTQVIHKFHGGCSYSGVPKLKNIAGLIEKELKLGVSAELLEPELLELLDELDNVEEEAQDYLS
ncbi:two-component sensor histidine kinase BarA [Psychromonas sp. RZ22]|uniref:two-component sensor histidine kinase BarA n=1 Tax=Psychromonas algarum TaxID=2555643 RepID=UPI0010677C38|nr:two-component sensor histidine kinase BarA [Psychromonas sp. RZ22]TEW56954.1 two-component sensor histidine kinase BarA [Psychromonas sp. RZ22]